MSKKITKMNIPAVKKIGRRFQAIGRILRTISKVLQGLILLLKATAFVGLFGGYALKAYLEQLKPVVDRLAAQCTDIGVKVNNSVLLHQGANVEGATFFDNN